MYIISCIQSHKSDNGGTSNAEASSRQPIAGFFHRSSSATAHIHPNPSPLSRVAGQQTWTEDEDERGDDEDSPSPASSSESDSDYSGNDHSGSRRSSRGKSSRRTRPTRSRSSTVASLAVDAHFSSTPGSTLVIHPPKLTKQGSQSSIRTVTAINSPHPDNESQKGVPHFLMRDDTIRDLSYGGSVIHDDAHSHKPPSSFRQAHKRVRSSLSTEFFIDREALVTPSALSNDEDFAESKTPASWYEETQAKDLENQMRNAGWDALKEALEIYADEVCCMSRCVLGISDRRMLS